MTGHECRITFLEVSGRVAVHVPKKVLTEPTTFQLEWESEMAGRTREFSSVVNKEGKWYVATCPELGITSQGKSVEESIDNLREAIELYLEDEDAQAPTSNYRPLVTVVKVGRA